MKPHLFVVKTVSACVAFALSLSAGCATKNVKSGTTQCIHPGDRVQVHVTCMLEDGRVIYSSRKEIQENPDTRSSQIFFKPENEGPVDITAGQNTCTVMHGNLKTFEGEVLACLGKDVCTMVPGQKSKVILETREPEGLSEKDRYLNLTKKRRHLKFGTVGEIPFEKQTGRKPVPGTEGPVMPPFSTRVLSVENKQVKLEIMFNEGDVLKMPFGNGILHHDGDYYVIDVDAKPGHLVKTSMLLGTITRVDEDTFTVDYGHPFGGQSLTCDVEIVSVTPDQGGKS